MRVDLASRRIVASVRELAFGSRVLRSGHGLWRSQLGAEAHRRYQRAQSAEEFEPEVSVERVLELAGFELTLRGRIDGVRRRPGGWLVEELKSVARATLEPSDGADEAARLQARLYALCIDLRREGEVEACIVLLPLVDGPTRAIAVGYRRDQVLDELERRVSAVVAEAEEDARRSATRRAVAAALRFPFSVQREPQRQLMEALDSALEQGRPLLAQAPTGTGKTVCALTAALPAALRRDAQLWFVTPKTTQQALVADTFERLVAASGAGETLRACTLTARARMCPPGDRRCHPDACELLDDFDAREREGRVLDALLKGEPHVASEVVLRLGVEHRLCPYELNRRLAERVDLVIGDYNYLFDPAASQASAPVRPRVVVIDEAHNLPDRARESLAVFVSRAQLMRVSAQLASDDVSLAADIRRFVDAVASALDEAEERAGEDELQPIDGCAACELDVTPWRALALQGQRIAARYLVERWSREEAVLDDPLLALVDEVRRMQQQLERAGDAFVAYVAGRDAPRGAGCGVLCLDAAEHLELCHRRALATVAMSATLAPLEHHADRLGLRRLGAMTASVPSPFAREQRLVRVAADIRTSLAHRDEDAPALARLIEDVVAQRDGAYAAYFPSYAYLDKVRRELTLSPPQLLVQLPASTIAQRTRQLERLRHGRGTRLLLAVMGGVFAEGVDLPGDALCGAIVVGLGLPPITLERLAMRAYYDARGEDGQACALVYPGLRKVVQAAGRVLRRADDVGVVVLVGRRFADPAALACLPEDWYRYDASELVAADLRGDLERFWAAWPAKTQLH